MNIDFAGKRYARLRKLLGALLPNGKVGMNALQKLTHLRRRSTFIKTSDDPSLPCLRRRNILTETGDDISSD